MGPGAPGYDREAARIHSSPFMWNQFRLHSEKRETQFLLDAKQISYINYSAAFQSVNHNLLIYQLQNDSNLWKRHKFTGIFLDKSEGTRYVNGQYSDWTHVHSGTPTGSLQSPLLFALFLNDLPKKFALSGICRHNSAPENMLPRRFKPTSERPQNSL